MAFDSNKSDPNAGYTTTTPGGLRIDVQRRYDGLGNEWQVSGPGGLIEQGRDKTETFPDGSVKHHAVWNLGQGPLSNGWTVDPLTGRAKPIPGNPFKEYTP